MKIFQCLLILLSLSALLAPTAFAALPAAQQPSLAKVLSKAMPGVVNIRVIAKPNPYIAAARAAKNLPPVKDGRIGSGVILSAAKGYIVTNAHVVVDASSIDVILKDSRSFKAKLVGIDQDADIAVIQIKAKHLTQLPVANSDKLKVGDFVAAIGSPYGLNQTVTSGIVSALQRDNLAKGNLDDFIQTDAPINPGNSGGALINMDGQFVGMNTAIITPDGGNAGIGFAIPANVVVNIAQQLVKYGKVLRGIVGIMAQNITPDIATALHSRGDMAIAGHGALVASVRKSSPAQEAGIQVGDVITAVNQQPINSAGELVSKMGLFRAGSKVIFTLHRDARIIKIAVVVAPPAQVELVTAKHDPYLFGLILENIHEYNPAYGNVRGIKVVNVKDQSNADRAGLAPGDIIVSANLKPIHSLQALQAMTRSSKHALMLNVIRQDAALFVVLKPAD